MAEEIFKDISNELKQNVEFVFNMAMRQNNPQSALKVLNDFTNSCVNEEEKQFVEFYFNLRMEQLLNGNNNNQR